MARIVTSVHRAKRAASAAEAGAGDRRADRHGEGEAQQVRRCARYGYGTGGAVIRRMRCSRNWRAGPRHEKGPPLHRMEQGTWDRIQGLRCFSKKNRRHMK